jgi:hypothetical protein
VAKIQPPQSKKKAWKICITDAVESIDGKKTAALCQTCCAYSSVATMVSSPSRQGRGDESSLTGPFFGSEIKLGTDSLVSHFWRQHLQYRRVTENTEDARFQQILAENSKVKPEDTEPKCTEALPATVGSLQESCSFLKREMSLPCSLVGTRKASKHTRFGFKTQFWIQNTHY